MAVKSSEGRRRFSKIGRRPGSNAIGGQIRILVIVRNTIPGVAAAV